MHMHNMISRSTLCSWSLLLATLVPSSGWAETGGSVSATWQMADASSTTPAAPAAPAAPATPATPAAPATPEADRDGTSTPILRTRDEFTGRNAIGLMVGIGSGSGVSYRRYLSDRVGVRSTGYVLYVRDVVSLFSLGLTGQFDFRRDEKSVFYGVGGVSFAQAKGLSTSTEGAKQLQEETSPIEDREPVFPLQLGVFPNVGAGFTWGDQTKPGLIYSVEVTLHGLFVNGACAPILCAAPMVQGGVFYHF